MLRDVERQALGREPTREISVDEEAMKVLKGLASSDLTALARLVQKQMDVLPEPELSVPALDLTHVTLKKAIEEITTAPPKSHPDAPESYEEAQAWIPATIAARW